MEAIMGIPGLGRERTQIEAWKDHQMGSTGFKKQILFERKDGNGHGPGAAIGQPMRLHPDMG